MSARGRFMIVEETRDVLPCERQGREVLGHVVDRDELRRHYPSLSLHCGRAITGTRRTFVQEPPG